MKGIAALAAAGGFAPAHPVKREVRWTNDEGQEYAFDVWVKHVSFGGASEIARSDKKEALAETIQHFIQFEDDAGERVSLTYEQAISLKSGLGFALLDAFNEVNGSKPKNSPPSTSSSASSSSTESAEAALLKPESA